MVTQNINRGHRNRRIVTIKLDGENFTYEPSSFRLFSEWNDRGRAAWESDKPFCIDFNDRSPFKHLTLSSKLADDGKHRTREVQVRRRFPSGRYKYRVFVYAPAADLIRIDDCPDVGVDEDKC